MKDTVFREYDIRGLVDSELTLLDMYQLGRAIFAYCLDQKMTSKTVLLGQDARISSPLIARELKNAAINSGLHVIDIGVVPSPIVYFGMYQKKADIGVMVTASHNPGQYNGIKIMLGTECIWGKAIQEIKSYFHEKKQVCIQQTPLIMDDKDFVDLYIAYLAEQFPLLHNNAMFMVFDCANAVSGVVMPKLIDTFGWSNATLLYEKLDGTFPVHEADPTVEHNMQDLRKVVLEKKANIGIGFDGDADRMAVISEKGILFLGDALLAIFTMALPEDMRKRGAVFNVTMSSALQKLFDTHEIPFFMVPTGHAVIKESMKKNNAAVGGEGSCHFFFADRYFGYDDGMYAALRLLEIMAVSFKTVTQLAELLPKRYSSREYRISCADDYKKIVVDNIKNEFSQQKDIQLLTIDGVRVTFPFGWGIVRAANTQPVISMRFESVTDEGLLEVKNRFHRLLRPYLGEKIDVIFKD